MTPVTSARLAPKPSWRNSRSTIDRGERGHDQVAATFDKAPESSRYHRRFQRWGSWNDDERVPAESTGLRGRLETQGISANPEPVESIERLRENFAAGGHVRVCAERGSLVEVGDQRPWLSGWHMPSKRASNIAGPFLMRLSADWWTTRPSSISSQRLAKASNAGLKVGSRARALFM